MLAALAVTPSASAPRVKLLCSATATKTRRLASGARRYAARGAAAALERRETRSAAAGDCGGGAAFFSPFGSRGGTGRRPGNHPQMALVIRPSPCGLSDRGCTPPQPPACGPGGPRDPIGSGRRLRRGRCFLSTLGLACRHGSLPGQSSASGADHTPVTLRAVGSSLHPRESSRLSARRPALSLQRRLTTLQLL